MRRTRFIGCLIMLLLVAGAAMNTARAAKVTYHILTLPIDSVNRYNHHMKAAVHGYRLEAVKIVVDDKAHTSVELPANYKSPLATDFTYYKPEDITGHGGSAINLYDYGPNKGVLYRVKGEDTPLDDSDDATPVAEGTAITTSTAEYYVTYTYNESSGHAKLDGSEKYNIQVRNKGFLALNRGRNNRPAVIPQDKVDPEMLSTEDFSYVEDPGNGIGTYWADGNNKNKRSDTESKFFFGFKLEGKDPYHIVIRTSYAKDSTYIEKNDNIKPDQFVYKWYKGGSLFAQGTANNYIASDEHIRYNKIYDINTYPTNPTNLTEGDGTGYIVRNGNYHGQSGVMWGTVALLNNTTNNGYVFMGTRTVDGNGAVPGPKDNTKYYYLTCNGYNNLVYAQLTPADATKNHTIERFYELKNVTFKIVTPFYAAEKSSAHIISYPDQVSQYTVDNDPIETKYLPASMRRKYCHFTGHFYKDPACTQEITMFSQATEDPSEGYQVYVGYELTSALPFKAITPAASYTAATWANATWYEMTDEASTQFDGLKLKFNTPNFKNNGADGVYDKTTEFAFIGDPYELRVVYRDATTGATAYYVGATGETPTTGTLLTTATSATAGYIWEIADDKTDGSFLLRKYKGGGCWYWNPGHPDAVAISYSTKSHTYNVAKANAQVVTFNVSNLGATYKEGDYIKVTASGTNSDQVTVTSDKIYVQTDKTASFTAALKGRGDGDKTFILSIQKYNYVEGGEDTTDGAVCEVTVNQNNSDLTENTVEYNTSSSTRIKLMTLPTRDFTYNIVDKSGRIAVKATATQTVYSPLSLASIPSIIISPYLYGETVTFWSSYSGGGRGNLSSQITELPAGNAASSTNIYVKYTTTALDAKPIKLSEDETFNVKLNGRYVYYDKTDDVLKTSTSTDKLTTSEYLWKLRNRDPYAMLIDNLGAREDLSVTGTETPTIYDDNGGTTTPIRQKGAWITLASIENAGALTFTTVRASAQPFVAKSSLQAGVYEVMVADGGAEDASTNYYNIGCPEDNTVKIYNKATHAHGSDELRFVLNQNVDYHYYLIDRSKHLLLSADSKTPDLALPADYQSPLVGTYHFYDEDNISHVGNTYDTISGATELTTISSLNAKYNAPVASSSSEYSAAGESFQKTASDDEDMLAKAKDLTATGWYFFEINNGASYKKLEVTKARYYDIYVTYEANDIVAFNTGEYMLKFLDPLAAGYYLEDGNDKLDRSAKVKAVYPYCNGDGNLNIYGNDMQKEQFGGGASTRPRWVWHFDSQNNDPYHVRVRSKSSINYNGSQYTYLTTYAVKFNQDGETHIVTGGTLPGVASATPMEYMVLGSAGNYKLFTTVDTISDGETRGRRQVRSFEQYWKTYNMLKRYVLEKPKSTNAFSNDTLTWVIPDSLRDDLETRLIALGVGSNKWHSYPVYANATRWNGYNDKENGEEKKVVEKLEHWFQTFDMGNGTFDIENAEIPPVLVLLDRHGWEIMRCPLPPTARYPEGEELAALSAYDSPLVDKYYFYSNATKATGCHKYSLRLNDKGEERDQIKVNGKHYTSTSLADLPPVTATGVKSNGVFNDQFVVYTVKNEYENNYSYSLDTTGAVYTETAVSQPYLMLQHGRFYKVETNNDSSYLSKPIFEHTNPVGGNVYDLIVSPQNKTVNIIDGSGNFLGNNFWYIKPNLNIDEEMGIPWTKVTGETDETTAKNKLKKEYWLNDKSGFDPYNIQIQLVNKNDKTPDGRYLTTHMTATNLDNGILVGDYTGSTDSIMIKLEVAGRETFSDEGYDHTTMRVTNQTFMAVSDASGNMQLMPRFDHTKRVTLEDVSPWNSRLEDPIDHGSKASADNNSSMGAQTTFFVCPQRFHYHIIDNYGREALSYKRGADFYPAITEHFKSPVAKDFTYYKGLAEKTADSTACTPGQWGAAQGQYKRTLTSESMFNDAIKLLPDTGWYYYRIGTRGNFKWRKIHIKTGLNDQHITGSFAEADVDGVDCDVYVRYDYDLDADLDADRLLQGQWYTVQLAEKDLQASGTLIVATGETQGTGVSLYAGNKPLVGGGDADDKPTTIDATQKKWQWKFFVAPADTVSDYYVKPDPYAIHLFNRLTNYTTNPSLEPSPMSVPIKVPNESTGADRFALLSHPSGGYALAVAKDYGRTYNYLFLNGESMTIPSSATAATTAEETGFTYKTPGISTGARVVLNDDVTHSFVYNVITNDGVHARQAKQSNEEADSHEFAPYLPDSAQTPLLNLEDYLYYGFASRSDDKYAVIPQTILSTLSGLYDDTIYVRYKPYDMDKTSFKVPNKRNKTGTGHVARNDSSVDVSLNINDGLPYNIIWEDDNIMQSPADPGATITDGGSHTLSGSTPYIWYITGNDPYALQIRHKSVNEEYVNGTSTLVAKSSAPTFMLLKKDGYTCGVLQVTGITGTNAGKKLTGVGDALTANAATAPKKFIIFGLSIHDLIYHLIIAKSCADKDNPKSGEYVDIPYRTGDGPYAEDYTWTSADTLRIYGTSQRDLESMNTGEGKHVPGEKYQLGDTITWNDSTYTYCYDAGSVSIGDELVLPNIFSRPNCTFEFYIEGIYQHGEHEGEPYTRLDNKYKGLKLKKLMSDEELIDQNVVVNVVYSFDNEVATNTGLGFVTSTDQNLWYTFETRDGATPYLAHYTNAWGLQSKEGRETRYTNDYLWTPLGDVFGFKMYNRYMLKNSGGVKNVMTMSAITDNQKLLLAEPGTGGYTKGNEIFELVAGDAEGYFRVHPVVNNTGTRYYVSRKTTPGDVDGDSKDDLNYTILSTTPCDWRYGLDMTLLDPYYERAGYVGGLTAAGKTRYETAVAGGKITDIQNVVYADSNIVAYTPGYYRLHNQPGVSGIDPVRYASGYLHETEKTAVSGGIPMHFYSKEGVSAIFDGDEDDLGSGFTVTAATQGDIPIDPTESDPSTIFYFNGTGTLEGNPRSTMQTQGLYVKGVQTDDDHGSAVMTATAGEATTFSLMDIGGAVLLIHDGTVPGSRKYLHFSQSYEVSSTNMIYDLKYFHNSPTDDAKWCMQPVQKTGTAGEGEMPLVVTTNNGGDGYYYATFYAPFDVLLPNDINDTTYNAYTCSKWYDTGVHPTPVPATNKYTEGKFVPANTPVILRVKDETGVLTLTLPNPEPSDSLPCVFKGSSLEKMLAKDVGHDVYTLGVPFVSPVTKDGDYDNSGEINAPLPEFATSGVGFYINATYNKESDAKQSLWQRNNRYVLHNKIYYRETSGGASAPAHSNGTQFVPVLFGDDEDQPDNNGESRIMDSGAYDILGRKVASEQEVRDGTWYQRLTPGIYIVNGKKVSLIPVRP